MMKPTKDQPLYLDAARKKKTWDARCERTATLGNRASMCF